MRMPREINIFMRRDTVGDAEKSSRTHGCQFFHRRLPTIISHDSTCQTAAKKHVRTLQNDDPVGSSLLCSKRRRRTCPPASDNNHRTFHVLPVLTEYHTLAQCFAHSDGFTTNYIKACSTYAFAAAHGSANSSKK